MAILDRARQQDNDNHYNDALDMVHDETLLSGKKNRFSLRKKSSQKILLNLFEKIQQAPDLGSDFEYTIKPRILQFYRLIAEANDSLFSLHDKSRIENILTRDFPRLFETYLSFPVGYRTSFLLDNGKTHYTTMIEDMKYLFSVLSRYEKEAQDNLNHQRLTHSKVIRELYRHEKTEKVGQVLSDTIDINIDMNNLKPDEVEKINLNEDDTKVFDNLKHHFLANVQKIQAKEHQRTELEELLKKRTFTRWNKANQAIKKLTLAQWYKNNSESIKSIALIVFCLGGMTSGIYMLEDMSKDTNRTDLMIKSVNFLNDEEPTIKNKSLNEQITQFKNYQNPDYRYNLAGLNWKLSSDKQNIRVTYNQISERGCWTLLNQLTTQMVLKNWQVNGKTIVPSDLESKTKENLSQCASGFSNNIIEFDVPLK